MTKKVMDRLLDELYECLERTGLPPEKFVVTKEDFSCLRKELNELEFAPPCSSVRIRGENYILLYGIPVDVE